MTLLVCLRCRQPIEPDEPIVVITTGCLSRWHSTNGERLFTAPGRWHWRCVPNAIKRYAPVAFDAGDGGPTD